MGHILEKVKKAIDIEIESLQNFREKLDPRFEDAIQLIMEMKGKVIITGVGKSGDIAKKLSSTMTSTGTEAIFLHPTDATHGDAGLIKKYLSTFRKIYKTQRCTIHSSSVSKTFSLLEISR